MASDIGKCVADGSEGSCPMITSVHGRRFVRSIWTVMLVKEMLFSIKVWQKTSPWCVIMNQRVRDNRCSGSTHRLRPTKKFKTQASAGKVTLTIFWDGSGPLLVHFQEKGQTVTSARYSDMLVNEVKPAIRSKPRGILSKRVLLLHDNARPHTAANTVDTLRALKFEVLKHPPYSPDLAPSDFY